MTIKLLSKRMFQKDETSSGAKAVAEKDDSKQAGCLVCPSQAKSGSRPAAPNSIPDRLRMEGILMFI